MRWSRLLPMLVIAVLLFYSFSMVGIWSIVLRGWRLPPLARAEVYALAFIEIGLVTGCGYMVYRLVEYSKECSRRRKLTDVDRLAYMLYGGAVLGLLVLSALCYYCLAGMTAGL